MRNEFIGAYAVLLYHKGGRIRPGGLEIIFDSTQVQPDIKLPVLYLVDSIIKNVGGAYTQKFSQSIVNMFTRTFKQVNHLNSVTRL